MNALPAIRPVNPGVDGQGARGCHTALALAIKFPFYPLLRP
jgi:hypothetical protein